MALAAKGQTTKVTLVGTTPVQVAAAKSPNEDRKSIQIVNRDLAQTVEFAWAVGTAANFPSGAGIPIPPGGSYIAAYYDQQRINNGDVWMAVVGSPATVIVSYTEN